MKKILASSALAVMMAVGSLGVVSTVTPAAAATFIDFGSGAGDDPYVENGFSVDPSRLVNGNCLLKPCLSLNDNEFSVITHAGGVFNLLSLNFNLLGKGNEPNVLTVFETLNPANTISFSVVNFIKNTYHFVDFGTQFVGVLSITLLTPGGGNVRVDNIAATCVGCPNEQPPAVPLPAAFPLLLGALGGLTWLSRRRKRNVTSA